MTKLIEAIFERSKACSEMVEEQLTKDKCQKKMICEQEDSTETKVDHQARKEVLHQRKFSCPTLPRLRDGMEELEVGCEDFESSVCFVRERSVDSDDGFSTVESVVDNMDKLNEISENVTKKKLKSKCRSQRKGYDGPANLLVGASSRFFKDFRRDEVYKRKMRALIEQRVMTKIRYANSKSECLMSESVSKLAVKSFHALKKLSAPHKYKTALVHHQPVFDCEFFVKKIPRPKHCKARPTIQRIQDLQSGLYCYPTVVRDVATWGKVKHSSDGMKHKCELFDMTADSSYPRASLVYQDLLVRASQKRQRTLHLATEESLEGEETAGCLIPLETDINDLRGNLSRISFEPPPSRDIIRVTLEVTQHKTVGFKTVSSVVNINTTFIQ